MRADRPEDAGLPPAPAGRSPTRWVSRPYPAATRSPVWWLTVFGLGIAIPWCKVGTPLTWGTLPTLALLALIPLAARRTVVFSGADWMASAGWPADDVVTLSRIDRIRGGMGRTGACYVLHDDRGGALTVWLHELTPEMRDQVVAAVRAAHARGVRSPAPPRRVSGLPAPAPARWIRQTLRPGGRRTPPGSLVDVPHDEEHRAQDGDQV